MSDTPRTDAVWKTTHTMYELAGEMKRIERELNAANDRIQSLIEERDRANRLADWKWNLRDEFQLLLGTDKIEEGIEAVKEMKRRINQLEDRIHRAAMAFFRDGSDGHVASQMLQILEEERRQK